ncbi:MULTISPECIES: streptophobe family protein [unclassified Streptomyces]|uniref:streptophobe family protein n=1 Tax=unclassified Streptomyces TaxID=2593676 RepID=UPI0040424D9A
MRSATNTGTAAGTGRRPAAVPWKDVLLSAIAAVSWALAGMAGTAALGLHLLQADSTASLGPMTAAVVALAAGGSVSPSGNVSAFGLKGAEAHSAVEITPLGVSLAGALLLSWFFLRSLRRAGVVVAPAELLARAGSVVVLFVAVLGGLAWAGHDVVTLDGGSLGLDRLPGTGGKGGGPSIPGIGDVGGLLPDRLGDLVHAKAAVGFTVDTAATLLGGALWCAGVLLIALLASRRAPLPPGWSAVHRAVRPAVSALATVLLVAVAAGLTAAAYAAAGDDHPARIAGAALLGAPNGVWLGLPLGLLVPWDGHATGALATFLPHPLDRLLTAHADRPVTLGRLADLDGRVRLLAVAAALAMLLAGILTAVRTPVGRPVAGRRARGALGFAARCGLRLGLSTALALPLLVRLTGVSVSSSLSVLGFDAFDAGVDLHGRLGPALLLGAAWGTAAGALGALAAWATSGAGTRAAPAARLAAGTGRVERGAAAEAAGAGAGGDRGVADEAAVGGDRGDSAYGDGGGAGPYTPGTPYRPPNPDTNPYLRVPEASRAPEYVRGEPPNTGPAGVPDDVYGAPTIAGPLDGAPPPRRHGTARRGDRSRGRDGTEWPPPPPPPPPPAPPGKRPRG